MFDIGWTELLLIGVVALIVVGPKDLPGMFRTLGRVTGKARAMAREFQRAMEQAADDSGVKDMAKEFRDAASTRDFGTDELKNFTRNPKGWARDAARKSVVQPEDEDAAEPEAAASKPARGAATEALAQARADAAAKRRAEVEAKRTADTPSDPDPADRP